MDLAKRLDGFVVSGVFSTFTLLFLIAAVVPDLNSPLWLRISLALLAFIKPGITVARFIYGFVLKRSALLSTSDGESVRCLKSSFYFRHLASRNSGTSVVEGGYVTNACCKLIGQIVRDLAGLKEDPQVVLLEVKRIRKSDALRNQYQEAYPEHPKWFAASQIASQSDNGDDPSRIQIDLFRDPDSALALCLNQPLDREDQDILVIDDLEAELCRHPIKRRAVIGGDGAKNHGSLMCIRIVTDRTGQGPALALSIHANDRRKFLDRHRATYLSECKDVIMMCLSLSGGLQVVPESERVEETE